MPTTAHQRIDNIILENGPDLLPILKRFEHLDPIEYQAVGIALFDSYRKGVEAAEAIMRKVAKGPTTEDLLQAGKAVRG